jgi:hypothetical protein
MGNSIEFSSKEGKAKISEERIKQESQTQQGFDADSPVQNIRDPVNWKKKQTKQ